MNQLKHISSSEFESEVLMSDTPVLVDFYATWCMPCQLLSPVLEKLAEEFRGRVKFVKVDTDQEPSLAAAEEIRGVPTMKIFHRGSVQDTIVGLAPLPTLRAKLEASALNIAPPAVV